MTPRRVSVDDAVAAGVLIESLTFWGFTATADVTLATMDIRLESLNVTEPQI